MARRQLDTAQYRKLALANAWAELHRQAIRDRNRLIREAQLIGLTQQQIADAVGLSRVQVGRILNTKEES